MLIGTDTGFSVVPYGEWHAREMELFVEYLGYSPVEALVGMTRENARLLGMDGVGALEAGKVGDAIVVEGDPTADVRVLQDKSRIAAVIKRGKLIDFGDDVWERTEMPYERVHPMATEWLTYEKVRGKQALG